ncbi:MAG: BatA and WFA domain-containing protein, partial [Candidatus Krumholzibacteria bacterium]|nr:BatA and WFA domain-containing protein [Candidatus Krumholzibacteria bacterium]
MNFLNPAFLLALIAVAVPLVIHIFSRRRLPEIPFSTLRFLKRSDKRSMRRISLRRLLLLILRMAGIALLALAFARPVVRGELAALFPAGGSRAACILLDRSYSMGVEEDEGVLFRRAKAGLSAILENMGKDDEVSVVLFDNAVEIVYEAERLECEVISRSLKKAGPSWSGTDLRSAVEEGRRILKKSRREAKELYIVSDFQRSALGGRKGFEIYNREASEDAEKETKKPGVGGGEAQSIRAFLLPVQPEPGANVAVERILTPRIALHRGEITTLKVTLRNTSNALRARFPLEVLVDEHRIMEKEIEIPPGGVREENIIFPVERTGWIRGEVRKAMDRLPADDRRFFTLHVREKINVLLVADGSSLYLEQALSPEGAD